MPYHTLVLDTQSSTSQLLQPSQPAVHAAVKKTRELPSNVYLQTRQNDVTNFTVKIGKGKASGQVFSCALFVGGFALAQRLGPLPLLLPVSRLLHALSEQLRVFGRLFALLHRTPALQDHATPLPLQRDGRDQALDLRRL